ncbi:MAG: 3-dehydroquinate synthase [Anaerolineaceae bacterium]|nr:MAG: 3-dehydroquinate synthase [Anaerolineaceae bacterium]
MYQDKINVNYEDKPSYSIIFDRDFTGLSKALSLLELENKRFMIISDSNVGMLYLHECIKLLKPMARSVTSLTFEAGEDSKNLDTVKLVYGRLIENKFDRKDIILALGGGVTGDLAGFIAATYLRGIEFIQLPTTLLAMADSSIGGKTGVDFMSYKNMIGAFHQPKLVYMNLSTLNTLPKREFNAGMSEIIKHGLIKDADFYNWLSKNMNNIRSLDYDTLKQMVIKSSLIKKNVVEVDPKEQSVRALLNFGHTIGHAIEKLMDFSLLHGECIAIGMVAAAYISHKRSYISSDRLDEIISSLKAYDLPVSVSGLSAEDIYTVTKLDKKMQSDKIKFVLLQEIGNAIIDTTVSKEEMLEAIRFIID